MFVSQEAQKLVKLHCRSKQNNIFFPYRYGTSGFRDNHKVLDSVMCRIGFLGCLRSFSMNGEAIGLMVTASHNDEIDNGIKLIDPRYTYIKKKYYKFTVYR